MSVHPSLKSKGEGKGKRSVFKRFERLKELIEKEKRKAGDSIFGLPKLKVLRWKVKKVKKAEEVEATAAEETTGGTGEKATPVAKEEKTEKKK